LVFELVSGKTPFRAKTSDAIYENILDMKIQWLPEIRGQCMDLIQRLVVNNPNFRLGHRLGAPEIKMHAWFNSINWKRLQMRQVPAPIIPNTSITPEMMEKDKNESGLEVDEYAELIGNNENLVLDELDPFKNFDQ
jgi:serine/threonine protein kinase